jgi:hypothetical protein
LTHTHTHTCCRPHSPSPSTCADTLSRLCATSATVSGCHCQSYRRAHKSRLLLLAHFLPRARQQHRASLQCLLREETNVTPSTHTNKHTHTHTHLAPLLLPNVCSQRRCRDTLGRATIRVHCVLIQRRCQDTHERATIRVHRVLVQGRAASTPHMRMHTKERPYVPT